MRNAAIRDFYHTPRDGLELRQSRRQQLRAALRLLGNGTGETVPELYRLYYNRLFSTIWLALNWGPYTPEIRRIADPQQRMYLSQVHSVDTCWQPAVQNAPEDGLLVEIGTGLSDGWARIALLMPKVKLVSLTIEADQAEMARSIAARLGVADRVEVRVGDLFDPATTRDLVGTADAVTAMGVIPHFPPPRKADGLHAMAALLKPSAPLLIFDAYRTTDFSRFMAGPSSAPCPGTPLRRTSDPPWTMPVSPSCASMPTRRRAASPSPTTSTPLTNYAKSSVRSWHGSSRGSSALS
ncbi:SAM-dependent methyltransferase [Streptomyces noboritoensis]|uniref:SAM-dependent methyltransferase n=1 Tax=Streptomyces noboritoensis TaxID=67337 RepID=A0ABV6TEU8_9ACTN